MDEILHNRRSARLKSYDYSQAGAYFVTVCVNNRELLLGKIGDGKISLNEYGHIATIFWHELSNHYDNIESDYFVIMPNHIHAIIIVGAGLPRPLNNGCGNIIWRGDRAPTLRLGNHSLSDRRRQNKAGSPPVFYGRQDYWKGSVWR